MTTRSTSRSPEPAQFVREALRLAPVASLPELRLHAAFPGSGLWRLGRGADVPPPYWAYLWPGGMALARHVLDHPHHVRGRRVLDLGTGSGLVAVAAALAGAADVLAADLDPHALAAVQLNAEANGVAVRTTDTDLTVGPAPDVDLLLAGDVFYAEDIATRMVDFFDRCLMENVEILVGDLGRAWLPRDRLRLLAEYPVGDVGDSRATSMHMGGVYAFEA